jgi:predicted hydrocarbon binding protein
MANAKGTVVIEVVKALRANRERAAALLPPKLAHYLEERIVVASWYPLDDYLVLLRAAGKVIKNGGANVYEKMGRDAARSHMSGTYSRLKKTTNRQASFTLLSSMYDSGELKVLEREPGHAVLEFANFAIPSRELCDTFSGYQAERMALMGFEDLKVRHTRCRAEGSNACIWELSWKGRELL